MLFFICIIVGVLSVVSFYLYRKLSKRRPYKVKIMHTAEDLRKNIVESVFPNPIIGENYANWHSSNGECGLTLLIGEDCFNITINKTTIEEETN